MSSTVRTAGSRPESGAGPDPHTGWPALAPGVPVLRRGPDRVQVGWDPDRALVLEPPTGVDTTRLAGLLSRLDGSRPATDTTAEALELGLGANTWTRVLDDLAAAGLVAPGRPAAPQPVRLHGRGPLTDLLAQWLPGPAVAVRVSATRLPDWHGEHALPALVVLTDDLVVEPRTRADLVAWAVPHLPVLLRDGSGIVGPLVLPGRTACLHCADLHRRDLDPAWPMLAAQLVGTVGCAGAAVVRATAAVACAQVEALLTGPSGRAPASLGATLTVDLDATGPVRRTWYPHPSCPCGAAR